MIPKECKRLAEVDFPIAVVSRHAAKEKSVRYGHPSTLHLWWARRPLAACRAMLMALLLPDPCDANCPEEFKKRARNILPRVQGKVGADDIDLRRELLRFIGDFANWDNSTSPVFLESARGLVKAAHGEEPPLIVDPFSGGGSIPLEALRIGCDTFAGDLNPVACTILKTILQDVPRGGIALADDLRTLGAEIRGVAEKELSAFYPLDPDGAKPIAYLWARTIICDTCGADVPLVRSFWLSKKANGKRALRYAVQRPKNKAPHAVFEVFEPLKDSDVPRGSVKRAKATCLCCNVVMVPERVRTQLIKQHGGANATVDEGGIRIGGATLLAVAIVKRGTDGRDYRVANASDYRNVWLAEGRLEELKNSITFPDGLPVVPDDALPLMSGTFNVPLYGMTRWSDLFSTRQMVTMLTILKEIRSRRNSSAASRIAGLAFSRFADIFNALCQWESTKTQVRHLFTRQAIPMLWDFAEPNPLGDQAGDYAVTLETMARVIAGSPEGCRPGQVQLTDACAFPLPDDSCDVWFTDPPYYFAVPYADLSDFFFVWLRRCFAEDPTIRDPYDPENRLTPKDRELCEMAHWDAVRYPNKDKEFFEKGMATAFSEGRRTLKDDGIGAVVFAHKTTEGWEALLSGMIQGRWVITASWPIATELANRLRARDSAALATSVHLVCRPRPDDAPVGDWTDVLRELPQRVGDWIERLQAEGVKGADLVFACIGPAMEIYSRYRRVEDAEGREIPLGGDPLAVEPYKRGFLAYVWETVGRLALEEVLGTAEARARNGAAGALEEDARLTALFLWTLQTTEADSAEVEASDAEDDPEEDEDEDKPQKKKIGYTLIYDVARRFAQPLGIHLDKWEGRIIETEKGIVRLLPASERASQLFGEADAAAISRRIEADVKASRNYSFAFMQDVGAVPEIKARGRGRKGAKPAGTAMPQAPAPQPVTTLDRLHAAMLLQRGGQTNGLRAMLREETQRGPDFLRLANALSRLYPKDSEEKRLLDAMLLAVPRN